MYRCMEPDVHRTDECSEDVDERSRLEALVGAPVQSDEPEAGHTREDDGAHDRCHPLYSLPLMTDTCLALLSPLSSRVPRCLCICCTACSDPSHLFLFLFHMTIFVQPHPQHSPFASVLVPLWETFELIALLNSLYPFHILDFPLSLITCIYCALMLEKL